jgi:16S rRNA (guanine527-N7)-methyltransferase
MSPRSVVPDLSPAEADWEPLARSAATFGVSLSSDQLHALRRYLALLCEWSERFNLTAIQRPDEIILKHFLDSLTCALAMDFSRSGTLIDVGSGAGFPGLVLKIAYPHLRVTLLDSLQKRVNFLNRVVQELGLADVRAVHARAEDAAQASPQPGSEGSLREAFDVVTARAVARLNVLVEWMLPFARVGGAALAMKGPAVAPEVEEATRGIRALGGGEAGVRELTLPGTDAGRSLVLIPKVRPTPRAYPRGAGAARKHPL